MAKKKEPIVYTGAIYTPPTTSLDFVQQFDTFNRLLISGLYNIVRPPKDWKRIQVFTQVSAGVTTQYTVPTGKQFMFLGAELVTVQTGQAYIVIYDVLGAGIPLIHGFVTGAGAIEQVSLANFAIPLILKQGEIIKVESYGVANTGLSTIYGYEYPVSSNPSLL